MILFNQNKEIPIIKESGSILMVPFKNSDGTSTATTQRQNSEQIGTCLSDDVIKILKSHDSKQFKEDSLMMISSIRLSSDMKWIEEDDSITEEWNYYIGYSIYLGGILGGGKYTIEKSDFDQKLRDVRLNSLLD